MIIRKLVLAGLVASVGFVSLAPSVASAAEFRRHKHKVCHFDRHRHQRVCHWVR